MRYKLYNERAELRELIRAQGLNGTKLAEILGFSTDTIYAWWGGIADPDCKTILQLAGVLKVPVERIVRIFARGKL